MPLFEQGHIADWNTCDWFCVRVLGPLAEQQGEACARAIAAWKDAPTLWQRRAAGELLGAIPRFLPPRRPASQTEAIGELSGQRVENLFRDFESGCY